MKVCRSCNQEKNDSDFDKGRRVCKKCRYIQYRERQRKKGLFPKPRKPRKKKSKAEKKKTRKEYYLKNKDKIIQRNRKYREKNREKVRKKAQEYRKKNIDKIRKYEKEYRKKKKEKISKEKTIYSREQYKTNMKYKLKKTVSNSIYCALKRYGGFKNFNSTFKHLPYTPGDLKKHLESQFEPWMTWENWGVYNSDTWDDNDPSTWTWQIDHIIPHSNFVYQHMSDDDFLSCWDLSNLRPLSAKENCRDRNRKINDIM